jgi:hypothetical protein
MNKREKNECPKRRGRKKRKLTTAFFSPLEKNLLIKVILVIENS